MSYQHTNRRGHVYHLQATPRAGGKVSYSFTARTPSGQLVEGLPEGHEVYERPEDGQVFLRRCRPGAILPLERQQTESSIRRLASLDNFIVQAEGKAIVVYVSDIEADSRLSMLSAIVPIDRADADSLRQFMLRQARYEKMLRFVLSDKKSRRFSAERWCFLGGIDNWYFLNGDKPLQELLDKYIPHLGRESFFELM
jgi:hypothetical protein